MFGLFKKKKKKTETIKTKGTSINGVVKQLQDDVAELRSDMKWMIKELGGKTEKPKVEKPKTTTAQKAYKVRVAGCYESGENFKLNKWKAFSNMEQAYKWAVAETKLFIADQLKDKKVKSRSAYFGETCDQNPERIKKGCMYRFNPSSKVPVLKLASTEKTGRHGKRNK